jgi:hypothetical protein
LREREEEERERRGEEWSGVERRRRRKAKKVNRSESKVQEQYAFRSSLEESEKFNHGFAARSCASKGKVARPGRV